MVKVNDYKKSQEGGLTQIYANAVSLLLALVSLGSAGCAGLRSTQTTEFDPAQNVTIVQSASNFLPSGLEDQGTIALNARKETPKEGEPQYFLVWEMTSMRRNRLAADPETRLVLRMDGEQKTLEPGGAGAAMSNIRSAIFFKVEADDLRKLGQAEEVSVQLKHKGKSIVKTLSEENRENFRLFSEVNLPREAINP